MDTSDEEVRELAAALKRRISHVYRELEAIRRLAARLEDTVATNDTSKGERSNGRQA